MAAREQRSGRVAPTEPASLLSSAGATGPKVTVALDRGASGNDGLRAGAVDRERHQTPLIRSGNDSDSVQIAQAGVELPPPAAVTVGPPIGGRPNGAAGSAAS